MSADAAVVHVQRRVVVDLQAVLGVQRRRALADDLRVLQAEVQVAVVGAASVADQQAGLLPVLDQRVLDGEGTRHLIRVVLDDSVAALDAVERLPADSCHLYVVDQSARGEVDDAAEAPAAVDLELAVAVDDQVADSDGRVQDADDAFQGFGPGSQSGSAVAGAVIVVVAVRPVPWIVMSLPFTLTPPTKLPSPTRRVPVAGLVDGLLDRRAGIPVVEAIVGRRCRRHRWFRRNGRTRPPTVKGS